MGEQSADPRAKALADYLRERARDFSMSADVTGGDHIARAGMALLDAAAIAEGLPADDSRLTALSEAGLFETMPDDTAAVVETPAMRAAVQRPLSGAPMSGTDIISLLVECGLGG